jgi:hypothetical protein
MGFLHGPRGAGPALSSALFSSVLLEKEQNLESSANCVPGYKISLHVKFVPLFCCRWQQVEWVGSKGIIRFNVSADQR